MKTDTDQAPTIAAQNARETLGRVFGFEDFRPGQEAVVTRLLEGRSVLSIFPTGGGKSLCFQLPALMLEGLTLVISPLIALMKDQLEFLVSRNVPAARLDSSLGREETLEVFDRLRSGHLKILYISPERLGNERFLHTLRRHKISLMAIDEAHCISEWGHNFRPDYLKIAKLARDLEVGCVLALTATATPEVADDIAAAFDIGRDDIVHTGFYRPNLRLYTTPCEGVERKKLLLQRLRERPPGPTIVYVTLQRTAEEVADFLAAKGFDAEPYHAGMETEDRNRIQDEFMASDHAIVVATIAFGMGVDKANIRSVYHYNLPKALENYAQEIGRAGRDGAESICELLACADDVVVLENFSYGDTPDPGAVAGLVRNVLSRGEVFDISLHDLSRDYDIRELVVRTLLAYLELDNVIRSTGPFYSFFKFQPLAESDRILARFDARRADFLRRVFKHSRAGIKWFSLDAAEVARAIGEPRERIVAALGYLEEVGDLILEASGVRFGYRLVELPSDMDGLCEKLSARFLMREEKDIARIRSVVAFAEEEGCLTRRLLSYFGETRGECGHCARCEGVRVVPLPPARYMALGKPESERLRGLLDEKHEALSTPRQITRFLCGLSSPATSRDRLKSHPLFGAFETIPFHQVRAFVEACA
jgi:ATP-dependent DNA helicase RecQ